MMGRMRNGPRRALGILAGAALLLGGAVCATVPVPLLDALQLAKPTSRLEAPAFDLATLSGRSVRLGDLRGRPILLYFWATW
jgi:cytochrome oxidase Cu insertion factor (SCO1/SenC/PrrC family)